MILRDILNHRLNWHTSNLKENTERKTYLSRKESHLDSEHVCGAHVIDVIVNKVGGGNKTVTEITLLCAHTHTLYRVCDAK